MLNCKDTSRLIAKSQDRPLSIRERWGLKFHLMMCSSCRRFDHQMALIRLAMHKMRTNPDSSESLALSGGARERIRYRMAQTKVSALDADCRTY